MHHTKNRLWQSCAAVRRCWSYGQPAAVPEVMSHIVPITSDGCCGLPCSAVKAWDKPHLPGSSPQPTSLGLVSTGFEAWVPKLVGGEVERSRSSLAAPAVTCPARFGWSGGCANTTLVESAVSPMLPIIAIRPIASI
jgi:hypothetical protein